MPILSFLFAHPLAVGAVAPDFSLLDEVGKQVRLSDFQGAKNVVLVFYPGDDTSVCTRQLCEFRDLWQEVVFKNTLVFGVNPQNAVKHSRFAAKYRFPFPLLVDKGQKIARQYGAAGFLVKRTVYLIGKSGVIRFAQRGKPSAAVVLASAE
jgi:thioredoxin-dependent peroxiredoxin